MRTYNIEARKSDSDIWEVVGEWEADCAEDAIYFWMDDQKYNDDRFNQIDADTYSIDGIEYDVRAVVR